MAKETVPGPDELLALVRSVLDDHKADDVAVIDLRGKSTIGDYMVVASGNSTRQVVAMAEHLMQALKDQGLVGFTPEGLRQGDWVLIDAGDVVIHLFRPEVRAFYSLEKMWGNELLEEESSSSSTGGR